MSKRNFGNIKSLLHFDYHYYREPRDALYDECKILKWERVGDVQTAGQNIPYDVEGTPKFGYRCLIVNAQAKVKALNVNNVLNLNSANKYELECFLQIPTELDGWNFFNGHSYKKSTEDMTYDEALIYAQSLGGHLVTVADAEEKNNLISMLVKGNCVWLGLTKTSEESWDDVTQWDDGTPLDLSVMSWKNASDTKNYAWTTKAGVLYTSEPEELQIAIVEFDYDVRLVGDIINLSGLFALKFVNGEVNLTSEAFGLNASSNGAVFTPGTWQHILTRIDNGNIYVYLDGTQIISATLLNATIQPEYITVGGFMGLLDEFVFKHDAGTGEPIIPTAQYNASLDVDNIGGFGNAKDGDVILTGDKVINSYAMINSVNGNVLTLSDWTNGTYTPSVGAEIMIHITKRKDTDYYITNRENFEAINQNEKAGLYAFAEIKEIDSTNNTITLESCAFDDFTINSELLITYYVQVLTVPNFGSVNIESNCTINPITFTNTTGGGIVAFRVKKDCALQGNIISHKYGTPREDLYQMTHSELIDRFLISQGGGVFITTGGNFVAMSGSHLGNDWNGTGQSHNGAAGFGGDGRSVQNSCYGYGGVGGGGGSGWNYGTDAGQNSSYQYGAGGGCGGNGGEGETNNGTAGGGGQGNSGGNGYYTGEKDATVKATINGGISFAGNGGAGGAPGGNGGIRNEGDEPACAGASVFLVAGRVCLDENTLSTGGEYTGAGQGGAGTGFAYIATKELG